MLDVINTVSDVKINNVDIDYGNYRFMAQTADGRVVPKSFTEIISLVRAKNPEQAEAMQHQFFPNRAKEMAQAEGQSIVEKRQAIIGRPLTEEEKKTSAGLQSISKTQTISGDRIQEVAEEEVALQTGEQIKGILSRSTSIPEENRALHQLASVVDTTKTGAFSGIEHVASKIASSLGDDELAMSLSQDGGLDVFEQKKLDIIIPYVEKFGGRGFTDKDRELVEKAIADKTNTKLGNKVFLATRLIGNNIEAMEAQLTKKLIEEGRAGDLQQELARFHKEQEGKLGEVVQLLQEAEKSGDSFEGVVKFLQNKGWVQ